MPTTTNFGWTTPADTDLVKDGAAAIRTLGNGIDTSLLDLKGGTTGQILSKASNTDLDYTWINNDQGDITAVTAGTGLTGGGTTGAVTLTNDMATSITAAGDIVVGTGNGTYDNLPIGTTGQILTADTTVSPYKVKWADPAGGGKVLQVVYGSTTTATTVASTSYTDTTLSATITPSSTNSKVLIFVNQVYDLTRTAAGNGGEIKLLRGATTIFEPGLGDGYKSLYISAGNATDIQLTNIQSMAYLDSPATTSATTYKTQGKVYQTANSGTIRFQNGSSISNIILMEIGA